MRISRLAVGDAVEFLAAFGVDTRIVAGVSHVDVCFVFRPLHKPVHATVDELGVGVALDDAGLLDIGLAVVRMVKEQRKACEVVVVALYDNILARGGVDQDG